MSNQPVAGREYLYKSNRNPVRVIELLADGRLRFEDLTTGKTHSTSTEHFMEKFEVYNPADITPKMYDVFIDVFNGELQTSEIARISAYDDADAKQMAFEWVTYVSEEDIKAQLANPTIDANGDEFDLWDSSHGVGFIISNIVELQEVPIQVLRPLGRQLKPVYVPRETQTNDLVNAHYFR